MAAPPSSHLHDLGLSVVVSRRSWLRAPVSVRSVRGAYSSVCPSARFARGLGLRRAPSRRRGVSWPGRSGAQYFPPP